MFNPQYVNAFFPLLSGMTARQWIPRICTTQQTEYNNTLTSVQNLEIILLIISGMHLRLGTSADDLIYTSLLGMSRQTSSILWTPQRHAEC